ncbi:MAG: OmpA family protein [Micavibrio sp.]|nr:OmpA family protein [Micavibrio sp.]
MKRYNTIAILSTALLSACSYFDAPQPQVTGVGQNMTAPAQWGPVKTYDSGAVEIFTFEDSPLNNSVASPITYYDDVQPPITYYGDVPPPSPAPPVESQPLTPNPYGDRPMEEGFTSYNSYSTDAPLVSTVNSVGLEKQEIKDGVIEVDPAGEKFELGPMSAKAFGSGKFAGGSVEIFSLGAPIRPTANTSAPNYQSFQTASLDNLTAHAPNGDAAVIIYFEHDNTTLASEELNKIEHFALAKKEPEEEVTVAGHASVKANYPNENLRKTVNLKVSLDRAFAVSQALIQSGVPADSIKVVGWGDSKPPLMVSGKTPEAAARRVEISI